MKFLPLPVQPCMLRTRGLLGDGFLKRGLTLFGPAYFGISGTRGGAHCAPPKYLGVGGGYGSNYFGNDLPMND